MEIVFKEPKTPHRWGNRPKRPPEDPKLPVKRFMKALPKGPEDWANNSPGTLAEVQSLYHELTLSSVSREQRASTGLMEVLQLFVGEHGDKLRDSSQIHMAVFVAACRVVIGEGQPKRVPAKVVDSLMHRYVEGPESRSRVYRGAIPAYIKMLDAMAYVLGNDAYELPLRRAPFLNLAHAFTDKNFACLNEIDVNDEMVSLDEVEVWRPHRDFDPELERLGISLRIPGLVYELFGHALR